MIYIHISFISFEPPLRHARFPRGRGLERGKREKGVYEYRHGTRTAESPLPHRATDAGSLLCTMSVNEGRMRYYYSFNSILSTRRDMPRTYARRAELEKLKK